MNESSKRSGTELKTGWLAFALAAAFGLLGANAFADAAGFSQSESPSFPLTRVASGLVLFFLTYTLTRYLFRLGEQLVSLLSTVSERPGLPVTITLLVCGTLCVLGALGLSLLDGPSLRGLQPSVSLSTPTISIPGAPNMPQMGGDMRVSGAVSVGGPSISVLVRPIVTLLTLLVGTALLSLGVWSSLKPPTPTLAPVTLPLVPEPALG